MTDPQHLADHVWKDAEALVERVEQAARSGVSPNLFFEDLTTGLRLTTAASAVAIWVEDRHEQTLLSRSGIAVHEVQLVELDDERRDHASVSRWIEGRGETDDRLLAMQCVQPDLRLGLDLRFSESVDIRLRRPLGELVEVILDLAVTVFLRSQLTDLRVQLDHRSDRDELIRKLNEGVSLVDSFTAIASAVAHELSVDRVSLLRRKSSRYRLVTASTQAKIDRRARQIRLLEKLSDLTLAGDGRFSFTVGCPSELSDEISDGLDTYLHQSGCRDIYIESIDDGQQDASVAAIVLERFRVPADDRREIGSLLDPIRQPLEHAVRGAIARDDAGWGLLASRLADGSARRRAVMIALGLCLIALASWVMPATLKIPVEGRVMAATRRAVFSPTEGLVAEVAVSNGQHVRRGDLLVALRSPSLDLQQRDIEAALSTSRTRLDSLLTLRSRGSGLSSRQQEPNTSADEQVLKAEIAGLEEQLLLLQQQQAELVLTSPIDGRVDRWNLEQALAARPVTHGQHLLDLTSSEDGWIIELELPDKNVNYVLDEQRLRRCRCTFRLRSDPTETHQGFVNHVADVAHLTPLGQSMVRVTVPLEAEATKDLRAGATVIAQIHCGERSIGFVWLRGLIQWVRSQSWY